MKNKICLLNGKIIDGEKINVENFEGELEIFDTNCCAILAYKDGKSVGIADTTEEYFFGILYKNLSMNLFDFEKMQDVKQCWILKISDNSDYLRPEYTQWNTLKEAVNYADKYKDENYTLEFAKIDNKYNDDYIEIFGWLDDDLHYNDVEKEICFKVASENIKYFE